MGEDKKSISNKEEMEQEIHHETGRHKGMRTQTDLIEDPRAAAFSPQIRRDGKSPSGKDKVLEEIEREKQFEKRNEKTQKG